MVGLGTDEGDDVIWTESIVQGAFVAQGKPLGDFNISPKFCHTGSGGISGLGRATLYANDPGRRMNNNLGAIRVKYLSDTENQIRRLFRGTAN